MKITAQLVDKYGVCNLDSPELHTDLARFAKRIKQKIPGSFFVDGGLGHGNLYLCLYGYPVTLGRISIDVSFAENKYNKRTYCVQAYRRLNAVGKSNVKESINIDTATRNAAKYLTVKPYHDVAEEFSHEVVKKRSAKVRPFESEMVQARTDLFGYDANRDLIAEVTEMFNAGHTFKRAAISERFVAYREKLATYEHVLADRPLGFDCLMGVMDRTHKVVKFVVVALKPTSGNELSPTYRPDTEVHAYTQLPEALPDHIQEAMPMLTMVDTGEYVEGFGVKISEGLYFVERRND